MSLVVETGACVPTANAFVTRAAFITYATDYQPGTTVANDAVTDAAILRASAWLTSYPEWDGSLACGRGLQGLSWPRSGVIDCNGDAVPDNEVPAEVRQAAFIAAFAELISPGILAPTLIPGQQKKSVKVDVIEVTYMTPVEQGVTGDPAGMLRPVLSAVYDLLKCIATFPNGMNIPWPWVA